jgi:hypothetical protein
MHEEQIVLEKVKNSTPQQKWNRGLELNVSFVIEPAG